VEKGNGLIHVLFPHVRAEVLRLLFSLPNRECYVRQMARATTFSLRAIQQELAKLTAAGLITDRSDRYHRFYRANRDHPLFHILHRLVVIGAGDRAFVSRRKKPHQRWRKTIEPLSPRMRQFGMGKKHRW
jgi:DNA-binding transcriptional ArsR family regulator